ncbi:hypothetical protein E2C01_016672 [Portunus trituberculatus]|uniref:Uncharacterized protein n=1 Tax=Portunus trituberculatus TaxID=210409 RepID=A0A5B7DQV6_PORTR|nr:hypothetical protein [Portunus trituberculatus]
MLCSSSVYSMRWRLRLHRVKEKCCMNDWRSGNSDRHSKQRMELQNSRRGSPLVLRCVVVVQAATNGGEVDRRRRRRREQCREVCSLREMSDAKLSSQEGHLWPVDSVLPGVPGVPTSTSSSDCSSRMHSTGMMEWPFLPSLRAGRPLREAGGLRASEVFFSLRGRVAGAAVAPIGIRLGSALARWRSPGLSVAGGASTK